MAEKVPDGRPPSVRLRVFRMAEPDAGDHGVAQSFAQFRDLRGFLVERHAPQDTEADVCCLGRGVGDGGGILRVIHHVFMIARPADGARAVRYDGPHECDHDPGPVRAQMDR